MDWSARSPDLNPIEHVWDFLGRRLAARTLPPVSIRKLRLALQDEWAAMPQQLIDTLILSMGRRCETCLAETGGKRKRRKKGQESPGERTDGRRRKKKSRRRKKRVGERESEARLEWRKGLSPEIGVKKTMNAGGVEYGT
ncbi:transposable element Tcb1 transposase [Trichonephila clavipes]|nr:transposable element Tcb1 transposase [Trichonephila clavipes]